MTGYTLELRQHFTPLQNRYDVLRTDGAAPQQLAYSEQKRMSLRERITFWTDKGKQDVVFTVGARNIVDLAGTYDIVGGDGTTLATVSKDVGASLLRSTYHVDFPNGLRVTGQERGTVKSILRRVSSYGFDFPWPFPIHFDFLTPEGQPLVVIERKMQLRDVYTIQVSEPSLDWRVAAALAVAADAFMNR